MPTTIDLENAKQIRQPMDVIISMEIPDEGTTLTFSGYTESAKVADGVLSHQDWPMRRLADLQEDGFPLDGSRVLYDPNTSASASNGKIGVRGNIGAPVAITVTGSRTIASLSIFATGAASVTYNGTTSQIAGGQVIIPVWATSITLTFNPAGTTTRIEVSDIIPGTVLNITNDTLIKAVVSLRSDLSIIDPTLPESELNVEVYNDADISEVVASLPEDSPITYRAGYDNDLSPERKFYVAGQVTWADNVLSIHAVDAVHFLDVQMPVTILIQNGSRPMKNFALWAFAKAGVSAGVTSVSNRNESGDISIERGKTLREILATMMWLWKVPSLGEYVEMEVVDAGIPTASILYSGGKRPKWAISESDCGDVSKTVDALIGAIEFDQTSLSYHGGGVEVAKLDWYKGGSGFLNIEDQTLSLVFLSRISLGTQYLSNMKDEKDPNYYHPGLFLEDGTEVCRIFFNSEAPESWFYGFYDGVKGEYYTQVIPWNAQLYGVSPSTGWQTLVNEGVIDSNATSVTLDVGGEKYEKNTSAVTIGSGRGLKLNLEFPDLAYYSYSDGAAFPQTGLELALRKSPVTGSFTWKGDPRMQPRDVVSFHRLDGTVEEITLENITITHEGGGTSAEITYRKGIV